MNVEKYKTYKTNFELLDKLILVGNEYKSKK